MDDPTNGHVWRPEHRIALIDGDIIVYSCAWATDKASNKSAALAAIRDMLLNMRETLSLTDATIYLSGKDNFRKKIAKSYKANRKDRVPPQYLEQCFQYITEIWGAEWVDGIEADDALGIAATEDPHKIIITIDKDLDQIPGWKYNWRKYKTYNVTPEQGVRAFWTQMLVGDTADNIKGVKGIGPVKAGKILAECQMNAQYFSTVYDTYIEGPGEDVFMETYKLLKILKYPKLEDNWVEIEYLTKLKEKSNE